MQAPMEKRRWLASAGLFQAALRTAVIEIPGFVAA
jgi:hypothetical protein